MMRYEPASQLLSKNAVILREQGYCQRRPPSTLGGVDIYEALYRANFEIPEHSHGRICLTLVMDGGQHDIVDRRRTPLSPGSVIYHPSGVPHANTFEKTTRCFELQLHSQWNNRLEGSQAEPLALRDGPLIRLFTELYEETLASDPSAELIVESLICAIAARIGNHQSETSLAFPTWLLTVRDMLHDLQDRPPTLDMLSSTVDRHPTHVAEAFRRHFGCTMGEYARGLRLAQVRRRLLQTEEPIAVLAMSMGFYDQAHMTRLFGARYGMPPRRYRRAFGTQTVQSS